MDDDAFRQLLEHLNLSWEGYRKVRKGVKKRIGRHMRTLECRHLSAYLKLLDREPAVRKACDRCMTVSISRFYRDRALWMALEDRLLPVLVDRFVDKINVWSAGCACGEEAYSFAIVWTLLGKRREPLPALELLATDSNEVSLARAPVGRYPHSSLKEVPDSIRSACFVSQKGGKQLQIKPFLARMVRFQLHDLLTAPPPQRFQLIFLRNNLLTYYQDSIKIPALKAIIAGMVKGGLLIIGSHETVPADAFGLEPDRRFDYVLRMAD